MPKKKFPTKQSPQKELGSLAVAYEKIKEQEHSIRERMEDLQNEINLPAQKKKYQGKYFRCSDGYNHAERWWIFIHVLEVRPNSEFLVDNFRITSDGKCEFNHREVYRYESMLKIQISGRDYRAALARFKAKLNQL